MNAEKKDPIKLETIIIINIFFGYHNYYQYYYGNILFLL